MNSTGSNNKQTTVDESSVEKPSVESENLVDIILRHAPYLTDRRKMNIVNESKSNEADGSFSLDAAEAKEASKDYESTDGDVSSDAPTNIAALPMNRRAGKSYVGNIDAIIDGKAYGWILAPSLSFVPVLLVDGRPIFSVTYPLPRPDVNESLGISGDTGFEFDVSGIRSNSKVELNLLIDNKLVHVADYHSPEHQIEENFFSQLNRALQICKQQDAIAVTCWDGGHNPIGRAKVLYDVAKSKRPAVIITYLFDSFGGRIWAPIRTSDIPILTIPWSRKSIYLSAIKKAGLTFDTVWICKQRFPSFELANYVSHENTALVLDFDDNEEEFSKGWASKDKAYGQTTINYARLLTSRVTARTAASISLKEKYDGKMVRHARNSIDEEQSNDQKREFEHELKVGFIGTVRPHKNLLEAARAIKAFNWSSDYTVKLHVYGDVGPEYLVEELEENEVVVKQNIPMSELNSYLSDMDVILTGFPSNNINTNSVTEYQISSKIGDALAVGRPVLVPEGPSVTDLDNTPGVFLFNTLNFSEMLHSALTHELDITLPFEFTLTGAYSQFEQAEEIAKTAKKANEVFNFLPNSNALNTSLQPTLVLLWKQNDSGLYGRRVDQIARSYKRNFKSHRVIILELMNTQTRCDFQEQAGNYISEHRLLLDQVPKKRVGMTDSDGVEIHQVQFSCSEDVSGSMESFLLENEIFPSNTVLILFPIIQNFKHIEPTIRSFPKIVDVVDNQFYWGAAVDQNERILQYYALGRTCDAMVFNSNENFKYFKNNEVYTDQTITNVIPNWYELPGNTQLTDQRPADSAERNVIYSGNMNDRIDWELVARLVDIDDKLYIHLVGTATKGLDNLLNVLNSDRVIFHGPLSEVNTLELLQKMDVAIMPHTVDGVSMYMNPLKIHMYQRLGIPTVSTDVPGIERSDILHIAKDRHSFVKIFTSLIKANPARAIEPTDDTGRAEYFELISSIRSAAVNKQIDVAPIETTGDQFAKAS